MPPRDAVKLAEMLDYCRKIMARTTGLSRVQFDADEDRRIVLAHFVQIVGEAARGVSPAEQQRHPAIPWRDIVGMRHRIVHDYVELDQDVLWTTVISDIPMLARLLETLGPDDRP